MKKLIVLSAFVVAAFTVRAQSISGTVKENDGAALSGAFLHLENTFLYTTSDSEGRFAFSGLEPGSYTIHVSFLGFADLYRAVSVAGDGESVVDLVMDPQPFTAEEVVVRGQRASAEVPMSYTDISKEELAELNLGQDIPELLNATPSLYFSSDAGNGVGYTYLRLRGSDQTNINVQINGIPLNDSESHGVFWVNMPDLTSSTESIQVQRGVGTSTNGAGAFGGSIDLLLDGIRTEGYGELSASYGSFDTRKLTASFGTGLLDGHWTIDGRLSDIRSDGYVDRSASDLNSYYLAASYTDERNSIRAITFGGHEVTQQAWFGTPEGVLTADTALALAFAYDNGFTTADIDDLLTFDRRFNYYSYDREVDDYGQDHYQLHFNRDLRSGMLLNVAGHYTKGQGYFEQYQDQDNFTHDTDFAYYGLDDPVIGQDTVTSGDFIRRRWLDNDFFGAIASLNIKRDRADTWIGGGWNKYLGGHFGELIWAQFASDSDIRDRYYENDATKADANIYAKTTYAISDGLSIFGDLQFRHVEYEFDGLLQDGSTAEQKSTYDFFNPKAGITYRPDDHQRAFVSFAVGHKEPNRDDHVESSPQSRPKAQTLYDLEMGYGRQHERYALEVVLYAMEYVDQLIATGEINDVGENVRVNVPDSYRRGIEFIAKWRPLPRGEWDFNIGLSQNRIKEFSDFTNAFDGEFNELPQLRTDYGDTDIAFSPQMIVGNTLSYMLFDDREKGRSLKVSLFSKYVGRQYLDNTSDDMKTIDSFFTNDLRLNLSLGGKRLKGVEFNFMIRNLLDEEYVSNGYTYKYIYDGAVTTFDAFSPQAGRNFMGGLTMRF